MGVFKNLIFKLIPFKELKKKTNVEYDIEINGDEFELVLKYELPKGYYLDVLKGLSKVYRKNIGMLDEWEADERVLRLVKNRFAGTIEKVAEQVKKDLPNFRIVDYKVEKMLFKQVGNKVETKVLIKGFCYA